jgi:hypothetical protein
MFHILEVRIIILLWVVVQLTGKLTPLVLIGDKGEPLSLSEFLQQILPFISSLLEKHVGAALGEKSVRWK